MERSTRWTLVLLALALAPRVARSQDVKYTESPDGVTYRETTSTITKQIPQTVMQNTEHTVLRGQWRADTQDVVRTYQIPITEYRWETYWQNRYNPFVQPTLAYHLVPRTRWEARTEVAKVPVTRYETVPDKVTVPVPVTTWHTVQDHQYSKVAVGKRPPGAASMAQAPGSAQFGSTGRQDSLPSPSSDTAWKASNSGSTTALSR
ncbi:MAG: hypothetical protein HYX69_18795 [Planctomycetia bacterium]|nr:hypothetical protein [Planctomycetia bacterium]